jgi:hypothetical protein
MTDTSLQIGGYGPYPGQERRRLDMLHVRMEAQERGVRQAADESERELWARLAVETRDAIEVAE